MFANRTLLIATKHSKEFVIAPLFEKSLMVKCVVNHDFDTDLLGTFSGEIERKSDVIETLRKKCLLALQSTNFDLVVASEGSFGAHPSHFLAHADDEFLMFKDLKNNLEIIERKLSFKTNFNQTVVENQKMLEDFAQKVMFPSHGIILKSSEKNPESIIKDCSTLSQLIEAFYSLKRNHNSVFVETDMRAHKNPTRMEIIKETTIQILKKINTLCPNCKFPGFDVKKINPGLPCESCGFKTKSTLSHIYGCNACNFTEEVFFPLDKKTEEPLYCDFCNP